MSEIEGLVAQIRQRMIEDEVDFVFDQVKGEENDHPAIGLARHLLLHALLGEANAPLLQGQQTTPILEGVLLGAQVEALRKDVLAGLSTVHSDLAGLRAEMIETYELVRSVLGTVEELRQIGGDVKALRNDIERIGRIAEDGPLLAQCGNEHLICSPAMEEAVGVRGELWDALQGRVATADDAGETPDGEAGSGADFLSDGATSGEPNGESGEVLPDGDAVSSDRMAGGDQMEATDAPEAESVSGPGHLTANEAADSVPVPPTALSAAWAPTLAERLRDIAAVLRVRGPLTQAEIVAAMREEIPGLDKKLLTNTLTNVIRRGDLIYTGEMKPGRGALLVKLIGLPQQETPEPRGESEAAAGTARLVQRVAAEDRRAQVIALMQEIGPATRGRLQHRLGWERKTLDNTLARMMALGQLIYSGQTEPGSRGPIRLIGLSGMELNEAAIATEQSVCASADLVDAPPAVGNSAGIDDEVEAMAEELVRQLKADADADEPVLKEDVVAEVQVLTGWDLEHADAFVQGVFLTIGQERGILTEDAPGSQDSDHPRSALSTVGQVAPEEPRSSRRPMESARSRRSAIVTAALPVVTMSAEIAQARRYIKDELAKKLPQISISTVMEIAGMDNMADARKLVSAVLDEVKPAGRGKAEGKSGVRPLDALPAGW